MTPPGGFNKFDAFVADLANGVHRLGRDTLRVILTNRVPRGSDSVRSDISEIRDGNGYTTGGTVVSVDGSYQILGTYRLVSSESGVTWVGSGTGFGPFRYAVLYNSTPDTGPLIGWWDYGSSISVGDGDPFTITFDSANGILQIR